jgi:hypothetical protein
VGRQDKTEGKVDRWWLEDRQQGEEPSLAEVVTDEGQGLNKVYFYTDFFLLLSPLLVLKSLVVHYTTLLTHGLPCESLKRWVGDMA